MARIFYEDDCDPAVIKGRKVAIIGFGSQATIFLITLSAFFPILLNTIAATREVPPRLVEAARMLGTTRVGVLMKVVVPAATPGIVSGLRIGLGLGWVILVLGEANGIDTGLGSMIMLAIGASVSSHA